MQIFIVLLAVERWHLCVGKFPILRRELWKYPIFRLLSQKKRNYLTIPHGIVHETSAITSVNRCVPFIIKIPLASLARNVLDYDTSMNKE